MTARMGKLLHKTLVENQRLFSDESQQGLNESGTPNIPCMQSRANLLKIGTSHTKFAKAYSQERT